MQFNEQMQFNETHLDIGFNKQFLYTYEYNN